MTPPKEPPPGCKTIPGIIVEVHTLLGPAWLTQDGKVTVNWCQRGVWPTEAEANEARRRFAK